MLASRDVLAMPTDTFCKRLRLGEGALSLVQIVHSVHEGSLGRVDAVQKVRLLIRQISQPVSLLAKAIRLLLFIELF